MSLTLGSEKVSDFGVELDLPEDTIEKAEWFAKRADFEHPINRTPDVIAAGSLYLAGLLDNKKRSRTDVKEVSDVSEVAISDCYQEICYHEDILMSKGTRMGQKQRREGVKHRDWQGVPE